MTESFKPDNKPGLDLWHEMYKGAEKDYKDLETRFIKVNKELEELKELHGLKKLTIEERLSKLEGQILEIQKNMKRMKRTERF